MAYGNLSSIYRAFHSSDPVEVDPGTLTSCLMQFTEPAMGDGSTDAMLLWLSLIRRIFTSEEPGPDADSAPSSTPSGESSWRKVLEFVQSNLLQMTSFVPFLVSSLAHKDQLVSYLASQVLHSVVCASRHIREDWLKTLFTLVDVPSHECLYSIQILKRLLKRVRKTKTFPESSALCLHSFILSHWTTARSLLSSKLREHPSSKWPELNFATFLSLSAEVLSSLPEEQGLMVVEGLEHLTVLVTQHCGSPSTLKELLKVYRNITGQFLSGERGTMVRRTLLDCLPKLLMSGALVQGVVCSVVARLQGRAGEDRNGEGDGSGEEGDVMCSNLERSVARWLVVLLMKCACLLEDQVACLQFESTLAQFSALCHLWLHPSSLPEVRRALFGLLSEQDGTLVETLSSSCQLWKKRSLLQTHPTLQFCVLATHLHQLVLEFLESVCYDHSLLLDFLISPETPGFLPFLLDYLGVCVAEWGALVAVCRQVDEATHGAPVEATSVSSSASLGAEAAVAGMCVSDSFSSTEHSYYTESTLDKVLDCLTRLQYALDRLSSSQLLPFPVDRLMLALSQVEQLYETM